MSNKSCATNLNWNYLFTVGQLGFDFIDQVILAFGEI